MHLKEAREKGKLKHFIKEREKTHPKASHKHFHGVVKSLRLRKLWNQNWVHCEGFFRELNRCSNSLLYFCMCFLDM